MTPQDRQIPPEVTRILADLVTIHNLHAEIAHSIAQLQVDSFPNNISIWGWFDTLCRNWDRNRNTLINSIENGRKAYYKDNNE